MAEVPYRFEKTHGARELTVRYDSLPVGAETDDQASVAGRVMLVRPMGRLTFATLRDSSGEIQLFATQGETSDFEAFSALSIGDWWELPGGW